MKNMLQSINVANVEIKVNYKFDNLEEPIILTIVENIKKGFNQKLDRYIEKHSKDDTEAHLNFQLAKNNKSLYDGNFNFKIWTENVIYKRENFKNILDLVTHFFDHAKEQLSKK